MALSILYVTIGLISLTTLPNVSPVVLLKVLTTKSKLSSVAVMASVKLPLFFSASGSTYTALTAFFLSTT